jgi:5-methylcytosine-specific restriction endonuclease McrA
MTVRATSQHASILRIASLSMLSFQVMHSSWQTSISFSAEAFQISLGHQQCHKRCNISNTRLFESLEEAMTRANKPKKKKRRRRKEKMVKRRSSSQLDKTPVPVSGDELANHVSSMYIDGSGGKMRQVEIKRKRQESESDLRINGSLAEQRAYVYKLDSHPALVLNADYQPLSVLPLSLWSWQETIKSLFTGKVQVVDIYPDVEVRAVNIDVPLPSVIALTEYVPQPHQTPAFTRRNVYLRDGYQCQYCAKTYKTMNLSLDHVVPRCVGGKLTWENTVTCCRKCNGRKGSTLPSDLLQVKGMRLIREPQVPSKFQLAAEAEKMVPRSVHSTWRPYLGLGRKPEIGKDNEHSKERGIEGE